MPAAVAAVAAPILKLWPAYSLGFTDRVANAFLTSDINRGFWRGTRSFVRKKGPAEVPRTAINASVAEMGQMSLCEGPI